mmetsp:Transcript_18885/g.27934  ORF Transcript_18885/g.27934 Transcript_18885/m.27934 type:complete len:334 (+) Transcript_18885:64-1065(+)|eukprot:CAMPEP_0194260470 /NCGR_PEP_ID=MMETSP0158-20130606/45529_1 /TAXON_ID=33649 /ORGANISM="Thalassionema nitzschioides, Strain L26-B" /LENGTH=333 /DNA_ID=CAMNT_0039000563 /DNA_START=29 /DNA_END=1030 /DNA_ORIENTATION=-
MNECPGKLARNNNPLNQLLSSLQKDQENPYLLLIQHSFSFQQRQRAASSVGADLSVYQQANVLTPAERAQRDACGSIWPAELASTYTKDIVVWVQTIAGTIPEKCCVIFSASDPLGWDTEKIETSSSSNLGNLEDLSMEIIELANTVPSNIIVFDSLTQLLMMHGLGGVLLFLQRLLKSSLTIIAPIFREMLTSSEHVLLEDLANALLVLEDGVATLLRQGVRERGNLMREEVLYEITNQNRLKLLSFEGKIDDSEERKVRTSEETIKEGGKGISLASSSGHEKPGKIVLKIEEESGENPEPYPTGQPKIYLEDDDPEFDDLDEEEPDDDLDI